MGGSQSVEVPGGGTEGYHVLRVRPVVSTGRVFQPFGRFVGRDVPFVSCGRTGGRREGTRLGRLADASPPRPATDAFTSVSAAAVRDNAGEVPVNHRPEEPAAYHRLANVGWRRPTCRDDPNGRSSFAAPYSYLTR